MKIAYIPGGLILLQPKNRHERMQAAFGVATGKVDAGMDLHGFGKLKHPPKDAVRDSTDVREKLAPGE